MPELALDDVEWRGPQTVRHLYERAELRMWGWLPRRVRLRLTTYGLAGASRYLSRGWHEQGGRSVCELREASRRLPATPKPARARAGTLDA
jgi:hypothetical protein